MYQDTDKSTALEAHMTTNASTIRAGAETRALVDGNGLLTGARRFWIGVASRDHVNVGVKGAFIQLNHGKKAPLRRLKAGDGVIMYSPRTASALLFPRS